VELRLGIDHGDRPGKQIATLSACWLESVAGHVYQRVHVIDETPETEGSTPQEDAQAIVDMLARNGQTWSDLTFAGGDRLHVGRHGRKTNRELGDAIAELIGVDQLDPPIETIKQGEGRGADSVRVRATWLFHRMVERGFWVHPRCERVRESLRETDLSDDDVKDAFDGVVYGLDDLTFPRATIAIVRNG